MNEPGNDIPKSIVGNLGAIVPTVWFSDLEKSSIWLRIYTSLMIAEADFVAAVRTFTGDRNILPKGHRALFACGSISDMKVPLYLSDLYADTSGKTRVDVTISERRLPATSCVFLGVPFLDDGVQGDEAAAIDSLDVLAGLLCLHVGQNGLRDMVFQGEVKANGEFSFAGNPQHVPRDCQGPYWHGQQGTDFSEIADQIEKLPERSSGRVRRALQLVNAGIRSNNGFFEYWTALEVLADGKSGRIKAKLARLHGIKNHNEVAHRTGFSMLERWRHDYIHRGVEPRMTGEVARFLQLLFLDLLRQELGLPTRRYGAVFLDKWDVVLKDT